MNRIPETTPLGPCLWEYLIETPDIAKTTHAGQFVIVRLHEKGERIPVTIVEMDDRVGGVRPVIREVGKTAFEMLDRFDAGDSLLDFVGPLGEPSEIELYGTTICIGGGVGVAPIFPIARGLKAAGDRAIGILGARNEKALFQWDKLAAVCDEIYVATGAGLPRFLRGPGNSLAASTRRTSFLPAPT